MCLKGSRNTVTRKTIVRVEDDIEYMLKAPYDVYVND